jgi:hypothetical protein
MRYEFASRTSYLVPRTVSLVPRTFLLSFQPFLDLLPCVKDPVLDCADRDHQVLRNFSILIAGYVHFKRDEQFLSKVVNVLPELFKFAALLRAVKCIQVLYIQKVKVFGCIGRCFCMPGPPVLIDKSVAHDREQPPFKIGILPELIPVLKGFQKCVLDQAMRFFTVAGESPGEGVERAAQAGNLTGELDGGHIEDG